MKIENWAQFSIFDLLKDEGGKTDFHFGWDENWKIRRIALYSTLWAVRGAERTLTFRRAFVIFSSKFSEKKFQARTVLPQDSVSLPPPPSPRPYIPALWVRLDSCVTRTFILTLELCWESTRFDRFTEPGTTIRRIYSGHTSGLEPCTTFNVFFFHFTDTGTFSS